MRLPVRRLRLRKLQLLLVWLGKLLLQLLLLLLLRLQLLWQWQLLQLLLLLLHLRLLLELLLSKLLAPDQLLQILLLPPLVCQAPKFLKLHPALQFPGHLPLPLRQALHRHLSLWEPTAALRGPGAAPGRPAEGAEHVLAGHRLLVHHAYGGQARAESAVALACHLREAEDVPAAWLSAAAAGHMHPRPGKWSQCC